MPPSAAEFRCFHDHSPAREILSPETLVWGPTGSCDILAVGLVRDGVDLEVSSPCGLIELEHGPSEVEKTNPQKENRMYQINS